MRIVGGSFGGRRFNPPSGIPARPTTDIAKEALFNILNNMLDVDGISTLDIFAGTGNISYELASRGAAQVTMVERDAPSINFIKKTVKELGIEEIAVIIKADVFRFLNQCTEQYHIIFADPPYALDALAELPVLVFKKNLLLPGGIFVLEHPPHYSFEAHPNFTKAKNYGGTIFTFFTQPTPIDV
jgi:16S rRNA (guanine(966)-N(2))-methyltransferase RsmD